MHEGYLKLSLQPLFEQLFLVIPQSSLHRPQKVKVLKLPITNCQLGLGGIKLGGGVKLRMGERGQTKYGKAEKYQISLCRKKSQVGPRNNENMH